MANVNALNWFEIPVTDLDRAAMFYKTLLGHDLKREVTEGRPELSLPSEGEGVGGALVQYDGYVPSVQGAVIYLNTRGDIEGVVSRVEAAGGKVLTPPFPIEPFGHIAFIMDTEGNRIGLHQN